MFDLLRTLLPCAALALGGCSFHSTATHWHGRVGIDGERIHVKSTTNVGFHLLVLLPFAGNSTIDATIDESCREIASRDSDKLRVVQSTSTNYWYALPPLSWLVSPVITEVVVEYRPSAKELAEVAALHRLQEERAAARREEDHSHVIPEPRR